MLVFVILSALWKSYIEFVCIDGRYLIIANGFFFLQALSSLTCEISDFSSCFQRYQQEDAHEFLQCFLDKLERCLDLRAKDKSPVSQNNNLVERVFGGRLVSKV